MSLGDAATLSPGLLIRMLTLTLNPSICRTRLLGLPPDIMDRGGEELHQEQSLRRDASCQQGGGGGGTGRDDRISREPDGGRSPPPQTLSRQTQAGARKAETGHT